MTSSAKGVRRRGLRPGSAAALVGALLLGALALAGGCRSADPASGQASVAALELSRRGGLYSLPEMQEAHIQRELGARHLERAYACRHQSDREWHFTKAWSAFEQATSGYHRALASAPAPYHAAIEREVETVADYLRMIQRDRVQPKPA